MGNWLKEMSVILIILGVIVILPSCGDKMDPIAEFDDSGLPDQVTYGENIQTLIEQNCTMCHAQSIQGADRQGAPVGVDLDTFQRAVEWAERSNIRIQAGTMPPAGGLSSYERSLFQKWIDQDLQE